MLAVYLYSNAKDTNAKAHMLAVYLYSNAKDTNAKANKTMYGICILIFLCKAYTVAVYIHSNTKDKKYVAQGMGSSFGEGSHNHA